MKKSLTKLEQEKKKKRLLAEEGEKLSVLGQESESKAAPYIKEEVARVAKEEKKKEADRLTILTDLKKKNDLYKKHVLFYLHNMLTDIQWPRKYQWGVWFDGKGVRLKIIAPDKKVYQRAFKLSLMPKYDLNMCYVFAVWAEDMLEITSRDYIWTPPGTKLKS